MGDNERRRRRLRHSGARPAAPPPAEPDEGHPSAVTAEVRDPEPAPAPRRPVPMERQPVESKPGEGRPPRRGGFPPSEDREAERGLRGLVGSGASQVSPTAGMRARDASRPSPAEEAEAMERLVVVRRNWVPREELPRSGGRPRG